MTATHKIKLPGGEVALVDQADQELVSQFLWWAQPDVNTTYVRGYRRGTPSRDLVRLHRVILDPPAGFHVDHKNHDGLDNRRANLRLATRALNQANQRPRKDNTSGYRGVSWHRGKRKWEARICVSGRMLYLGRFSEPWAAAEAYNRAAFAVWGEFAPANCQITDEPTHEQLRLHSLASSPSPTDQDYARAHEGAERLRAAMHEQALVEADAFLREMTDGES